MFTWWLQSGDLILAVVEGTRREHGVREGQRPDVQDAEVEQLHHFAETLAGVLRQNEVLVAGRIGAIDVDYVGGLIDLHVQLDPGVGGHGWKAPIQTLEDDQLHAQDFLLGTSSVGDVCKLLQFRRVDLLNLGGYEEASDSWKRENVL